MERKKVLITGANGFLGGRVTEDFLAKGYEVTATSRQSTLKDNTLICKYIMADLVSEKDVLHLDDGYDCIIHCAAKSSPWGGYDEFYAANVTASENILELARRNKVPKIVFISTPSIYFTFGDRINIKEDDPLPEPMVNHYATTKYIAEQMLLRSDIPTIALRPRALIGRGDTVIMERVLIAYEAGKLKVIGKGDNMVDLTPVANVVQAVHDAMSAPASAWNEAYNITSGAPVNLWKTITTLFQKLDKPFFAKKVPFGLAFRIAHFSELISKYFTKKEPALTRYSIGILKYNMTMDISKAREKLGFQPIQDVASGMDEFVKWWKEKQ